MRGHLPFADESVCAVYVAITLIESAKKSFRSSSFPFTMVTLFHLRDASISK